MEHLTTIADAVDALIEVVSDRVEKGGVNTIGLSTGFSKLDETFGGLRKDTVYLFGGRPGMGKSALAMSLAGEVSRANGKVLLLSLEMSAELLALRFLASQTGIPAADIEYGRLTKEQFNRLTAVRKEAQTLTFMLYDGTLDSDQLLELTEEYQAKFGLDLLIVDYVSLLRDGSKFGENERVSRISRNIRQAVRTCDIPALVLAQLNREVEKREGHMPILSDFRDSGALEQDAAVAGFVLRPHYYAMLHDGAEEVEVETDAKIIIAKNRFGRTGTLEVEFVANQTLWRDPNRKPRTPPPAQTGSLVAKVKEGR